MGYANVEDNPFYNAMTNIEDKVGDAWHGFGSGIYNIGFKPTGNIKVRRSGDLFGKNAAQASTNPPSNEFFRQDVDENAIPDYLQLDTASMYNDNLRGMSYGGYTPKYQNAGTTGSVENINTALDDLNVRDGDYHAAVKAYNQGTHTPDQLNIMNRVDDYVSNYSSKSDKPTTTQTNTEPTTQTNTGAGGINGWHGGFYFQNGVPVTSIQDIQNSQQGQTNTFNPAALFQPGQSNFKMPGNLMNLASNPAMVKQFGEALSNFQPDNVYLSKAKGRVNPFGAKVVLKWDYDENGRPVQKEVVEGEEEGEEEATYGNPKNSNLMGRIRSKFDVMKYDREQRRAGEEPLATNVSRQNYSLSPDSSGENIMNMMTQGQTGNYTDQMPISSGSDEAPFVVPNIPGFAYGGIPKARAGKMVIKENYAPQWDTVGQGISPRMDRLSSFLEQKDLNQMENRIYTPDAYIGSVPMGPMSMGTKGMGPLMGKENRFASNLGVTGNYGDSLYQNVPGYELSGQMPYQPMGRDGGMYQVGGTYELSDEELEDIVNNGGEFQYY